jgi:glycosyltransferase involved in cell wall biosynthesis
VPSFLFDVKIYIIRQMKFIDFSLQPIETPLSKTCVSRGPSARRKKSEYGISEGFTDLVCFSHLRWNFVFQRPQHLLSRYASKRRVFFVEEPIFGGSFNKLQIQTTPEQVIVVTPHLRPGYREGEINSVLRKLIDGLFNDHVEDSYALWYYTPMALPFSRHLKPRCIIYDCMDDLSGFVGAPPTLRQLEEELFQRASVVFTGGQSLYEAKRGKHRNIHSFPSSIDKKHFGKARQGGVEPVDLRSIPRPRIGFFGVIDERMDIKLLGQLARARPNFHFIIIGPTVKINPVLLPKFRNLHYLGMKDYQELPSYLAHWDAAFMPFALNDSTRFISPTKTPEFLAGGLPVVSTPITDVVRPYGDNGLVHIAGDRRSFVEALDVALEQKLDTGWRTRVDRYLADQSWDDTWRRMDKHILRSIPSRNQLTAVG